MTAMNQTYRRKAIAALLLLLVIAGAPVAAQSLDDLLDRSAFSATDRQEIVELFATADAARVPEDLLLPRLAEGVAKRVPPARILAALRNEVRSLLDARAFLREIDADLLLDDAASWARTANLLDADIDEDAVALLARAAAQRPRSFRPASALLVSLLEWGVQETDATALAAAAVGSAIDPSDYPVVVDILAEGRIQRIDVASIVERLLEKLPEARSARSLRRSVLR